MLRAVRMLSWFARRWWWDFLAWGKFFFSRPPKIERPVDDWQPIVPKPMFEAIPALPVYKVMVCPRADVPKDERNARNTKFYDIQVRLYSTCLSPMQAGLPQIDADPQVALKKAFNGLRRKQFPAPKLPAEFLGSPDLGSLAVRGPFACYTTQIGNNSFAWDLDMLNGYQHHPDLIKIGSRVRFSVDTVQRSLRAVEIDCALGKKITPTDARWDRASKIVLCAASTHLSLVRHFNWVHLAGGAQLAIATRNCLSANHPLFRLLWPYIYGTQQSNDMVTRGQMVPGGDFETIFSLKFDEMCRLFDDTYVNYPHIVNDPEEDGKLRGVRGAGFDTPTQDNLEELFDVLHHFVRNYLKIYYSEYPTGANGVRRDPATLTWLTELNKLVPSVDVDATNVTRANLARMLASQLYLVTVQHEILGSFMWNYQLWTHRQPARIYNDFRREPLDVYQRLVNANYNLNVHRRALMHNFDDIALDYRAKLAMIQFQADLAKLQAEMDSQPYAVWKVYPRDLKVNINA